MSDNRISISAKVRRLLFGISISATLVVGIVAVIGAVNLRNVTMKASNELGESAATDSSKALEVLIKEQLSSVAKNRMALGDEKLGHIQTFVKMLKDEAEDMVANPQNYSSVSVSKPDAKNDGTIKTQFLFPEGLDLTEFADEMGLMGNIARPLESIALHNDVVFSIYLTTETGLYYIADNVSSKKPLFFDTRERPWYISAKEAGELCWSDVFDDVSGRGLSLTCASPYYDPQGNLRGVVGLGTILNFLNDIVLETKIGETGYAFVLNEQGQMIISPTIEKDENGNIIREDMLLAKNPALRAAAERMIAGENGITKVEIDGQEYFMAYEPFQVVPWSFATLISVDEALAPAYQSQQRIITLKNSALSEMDSIIIIIIISFALAVLVIILVISILSRRFSDALTKPIADLGEGVERIANGNLDYVVNVQTNDEIEDLSNSVNKMALDLKEHIANLQHVTAEKERIGAELNVATKIQASMLPCIFPAFPEQSEFDIYASMLPAKEVGGDFYDFFLIDENKLAVVMADVSGKGVPAALFMVIAKTLIKNNAQYGKAPKDVFETVNDMLCENNEAGMFVTAFMGVLDIPTGKFEYVNAGHNPPIIKRKGEDFEWLATKPGFVLAGMEGIPYKQDETVLSEGDMLYLYTDGVTEAVNTKEELFTDPKLLVVANKYKECTLKEFLENIKAEVDIFADGAEQADDITMLAIKILGGNT